MIDWIGTRLPRLAARFFPDLLWRVPIRERVLFLTFDDGPTPEGTGRLLTLLDRHRAGATFFLIGRNARAEPGLVQALDAAGHAVGNHTYTHVDAWRTRPAALHAELNRTTEVLEDALGKKPAWMRPPFGRFTPGLRRWAQTHGQRLVMWDVMPGDFLIGATPRAVARRMARFARPGSILVLHDHPRMHAVTIPALEEALPRLADEGWRFEALAQSDVP